MNIQTYWHLSLTIEYCIVHYLINDNIDYVFRNAQGMEGTILYWRWLLGLLALCPPCRHYTPSLHTHYTRSFTTLAAPAPATTYSIIVLCQIVNLECFIFFLLQDLIWSNWKIGTTMFNGITNVMILKFKAFNSAY